MKLRSETLFAVNGADVNRQDDVGMTPLHEAASEGTNIIVLYLFSFVLNLSSLS